MHFLYNILSYLFLPLAIFKLLKNKKGERLKERLGCFIPIETEVIWVHCVSVGEFLAAKVLIDALLENHSVLITTTTQTASNEVIKTYSNRVYHLFFPFDCPLIIKRYLRKLHIKKVLIMETEIWANLIHYLHQSHIPCWIINARMSEKSFKKYQRFGEFSAQTLNKLNALLTQNSSSYQYFSRLGVCQNHLVNTGNIKFDQFQINPYIDKQLTFLTQFNKPIIVFASTHAGEEAQILTAYLKKPNPPEALLIIIPRHPERFDEVFKLIEQHKISVTRRSQCLNTLAPDTQILLGDSMGEMMAYLTVADVVFMGGSLNQTGGHNMLEPATLGKAILFGKNVFNFNEIAHDLISCNGAIQVENADELWQQIDKLLASSTQRKTLGDNAQQYLRHHQGVLKKILKEVGNGLLSSKK
jgi:3-deoxy-D-manno-octulosonic-acid transferase